MIEIRPSHPDETSRVRQLWQTVFGDEDPYLDFFFTGGYRPENMLLLLEEGSAETMLYLMPLTLRGPGFTASAHYVYALATDPAARKKGYGRQLLRYVDEHLGRLGADCVTVVPAEPSLHKFFATVGFNECFATRLEEVPEALVPTPEPGAALSPLCPEDYNALRRTLLSGAWHVDYDDPLIRYQACLSRLSGGGLYRLEIGGEIGCAAVEYDGEDTVVVKELIMTDACLPQAVAQVAGLLRARRYLVRTPAFQAGLTGSYIQPFGMIKWYAPEKETAWTRDPLAYMGLGFD